MTSEQKISTPEMQKLPEQLPFPTIVNIFIRDTSKFPEAYEILLKLGLIPKPLSSNARLLEDIRQTPNIGWKKERCLVMPVPGKENMIPTHGDGWGIYRVVFREKIEADEYTEGKSPSLDFKYCLRSTPENDFIKHNVIKINPMGRLKIVDQNGEPLEIV